MHTAKELHLLESGLLSFSQTYGSIESDLPPLAKRYGYKSNKKYNTLIRSHVDQVLVEVRVCFLRIVDIDTLKQNFLADVFIQAKWLEPALAGRKQVVSMNIAEYNWFPLLHSIIAI